MRRASASPSRRRASSGGSRRPRRTLRVVAFANEENGLAGSRAYAKAHAGELPFHVAAIECDSGAGRVSGFGWIAGPSAEGTLASVAEILKPFGVGNLKKGGGGADVGALRAAGVPLFSPIQDSSRYFDVHHSADDTFDKIDREELNYRSRDDRRSRLRARRIRGASRAHPRGRARRAASRTLEEDA